MRRLLARLFMCLMLCPAPVLAGPDRQDVSLGDRSYLIDLPDQPTGAPVLLVLHGGGGNGAQIARNSGIGAPATAAGYAVIYPQGTARRGPLRTWNAGMCCGQASARGIDDMAFLDRVVADAAARFGLDERAVFITGMSNGAMMAERYGAGRPRTVRAVAAVSGTLDPAFAVQGPVPFLQIHGTADEHVRYEGGSGKKGLSGVPFAPVEATVATFVTAQARPLAVGTRLIDPVSDGMSVTETDWTDAAGRVRVRLMKIEGGGHTWPGGRRGPGQGSTRDITANAEILRFFAQYRRAP